MRLIVAIPNFNSGNNLVHLLPQLLNEDFDAVYVLDDASTDNSLQLLYEFSEKVEVVEGEKNLGPGGNRNRIMPFVQNNDIIMFVDADMALRTRGVRKTIIELLSANPNVGIIGGGILNRKGKPMSFNYGNNQSFRRDAIGMFWQYLAMILHFRILILPFRIIARKFTQNVEIAHFKPQQRSADWVAEGHFYMRGVAFNKLNGFDEQLQYGEGADLARRLRKEGPTIIFNPSLWTQHLEIRTRKVNKFKEHSKVKAKAQNNKNEPSTSAGDS